MLKENTETTEIVSQNLFPVVGIGASAGGLNAFKELIKAIPENSGMAYILIQHLAPEHQSLLTEILQRFSTLPVIEITNNIKVLPDHIYIIPENKSLTASDGVLKLNALVKGEKLNTIDIFFTSLAEVHQTYAIGILLSGTGSDGTVGLKTIKDVGGYTIAQDSSAEFEAMPKNAIAAGVVDFVMAPKDMPERLRELVRTGRIAQSNFNISDDILEDEIFNQVLAFLRVKRSIDFTYYKQTTIRRRILRRKALNRIEKLKDYQNFLMENKTEQDALYKDILIPVTAFFRDPEVFTSLCASAFPVLFKNKLIAEPVRFWVAGCSTGEEAYSMAMCLHEYFTDKSAPAGIQIFATDVSEVTIAKARSGIYQKKDMAGVSEARKKQFFTKIDGSYQINKTIREMVVFATQNFLKDPPFAKLDLISCRNVLIYMQPYLQKKAFATFHYALNNKGMLFLGKSESIVQPSQQFSVFNKLDKLYAKIQSTSKSMPVTRELNESSLKRNSTFTKLTEKKDDFQKAAEAALLLKYNFVGVIVNDQLDILQFRGSTGAYLEAQPGKASLNILKMAKEGLSFELRNALHKAKSGNEIVRKENISLDRGKRRVSIEVIPLHNTIELYYLVLFEETHESDKNIKGTKKTNNNDAKLQTSNTLIRIQQLEKELAQAREDMRTITEEQEAANEELQSANEELLSGSEELQTLNEELETSKEEIQSSNEELTILNQELIERNEQLVHARKYAEAIVATIHEPLVILTNDFRIKSANKSFYQTFDFSDQQTEGKLFFEWKEGIWNVAELRERLQNVLPSHSFFEDFEITVPGTNDNKRCLLLNGRQLINDTSDEQLILLAMEDISVRKELEHKQKSFSQELELQVSERTKELKDANMNLQYSNDNLQQFASIASHDLQEPLRKIRTFTSVLNKSYGKDFNEEGKEVISKISIAAGRMSQLIKEVLEYTKVARVYKEFYPTDLNAIMKKVMADLELLITETKAKIVYEKSLPVIDAVPSQMNQLMYNILNNALKFYRRSILPEITISYKMLTGNEVKKFANLNTDISYIEIRISDNGIGFEQQFAEQIFQIFERLHSVTEYEGTGIGLALCKKIVENHYGHIYAISQENEGASFYVILPVNQ